jgi:sigma-B regulation protein RsbU (phosphoserine phosphatase)
VKANHGLILVVDDNEMNRDMLSRRLIRKGYEVRVAADGREALELIEKHPFELVLLDIMMPGIDGLEVLETLRQTRPLEELAVVMATAKDQSEDIVKALKLGANDYVTKPIDFPVALARVRTQLSLVQSVRRIKQLERSLAQRNQELESANTQLATSNQRMKLDLEAAARIQQAFLPSEEPNLPGVRFAWRYVPCDELAGDTLNIVPLDSENVGVFVLDVSGHGVPSALLSVTLSRALSRTPETSVLWKQLEGSSAPVIANPLEVATELTRRFPFDPETSQYFTLVYGILNTATKEFKYVCAGHPGPIHCKGGSKPDFLENTGPPVGLLPIGLFTSQCEEASVRLSPGDRVYVYTDGIAEAADREEQQFGAERISEVLDGASEQPLDEGISMLLGQVQAWCADTGLDDDVSILALEIE